MLFGQARPGSSFLTGRNFCPLCRGCHPEGKSFLAVALQVVKFSDTEFFDEQLREQFAENMALQGGAPWPGSNYDNFKVGLFCQLQLLPFTGTVPCRSVEVP